MNTKSNQSPPRPDPITAPPGRQDSQTCVTLTARRRAQPAAESRGRAALDRPRLRRRRIQSRNFAPSLAQPLLFCLPQQLRPRPTKLGSTLTSPSLYLLTHKACPPTPTTTTNPALAATESPARLILTTLSHHHLPGPSLLRPTHRQQRRTVLRAASHRRR